ncbi:MAG: HAD hydrolase family protein [Lachnospiraceae bacterium]|nr:HAD hydrolase family protein [Lachnospiraceae bacterium]
MAILFLDVDGTLINYKARIPSSAKEAVIAARKNGHFVFLCTGCSKQEILERHFDFELDGLIKGNGNYIEVQGTEIFHKPLTYVQCKHFTDWCISRSLAYRFECNSGIYISDDYMEKSVQARMKYAFGNNKSAVNAPTNPAFREWGVRTKSWTKERTNICTHRIRKRKHWTYMIKAYLLQRL